LVEGRAGLAVPFERRAFSAALGKLLDDEPLRARLRAGCAEVALSLTWEEPLAETEALYSLLLAERCRE
jgi:glycosyltransferase involved in cell wall biosynthesis